MTIKNKKTKQSKSSEVTSSTSASTSVQKTSSTTSVQSSNTLQKVSSGKKVRYIEVKVEEDDPLMITDVTDHSSIAGSTISEHYNSHPHYIITEAPSMTDLSQVRAVEHNVSDMAQSNSGEFVSSSVLQESSSTHQQSSKSETFQTSSTSVQHSGSSHSQTFDRTTDSSVANQTLDTAFIDSSTGNVSNSNTYTRRSQPANASNAFLQNERQNLVSQVSSSTNAESTNTVKSSYQPNKQKQKILKGGKLVYRDSPEPSKRNQTVRSDPKDFYGGEGSLDKKGNTKQFSTTSQTSESKSSNVTKSSSSSYVVEIVDGKERVIDSSKREWGDAQEHASKEDYVSVSGTGMKPQSSHSIQNYDMKAKYDTGKDGQKPTSELTVAEDSKFIKDGKQTTTHSSVISEKDKLAKHQQYVTDRENITADRTSLTRDDQLRRPITDRDYTTSDRQSSTRDDRQYITNVDQTTSDRQSSVTRDDTQYVTSHDRTTYDQQSTVTRDDREYITSRDQTTSDRQSSVTSDNRQNVTSYDQTTSDRQSSVTRDDRKNITNRNQTPSDRQPSAPRDDRKNIINRDQTTPDRQSSVPRDDQHHIINREHVTSDYQSSDSRHTTHESKTVSEDYTTNQTSKDIVQRTTTNRDDNRRNAHKTDSSNFYGYDATIQDELKRVGTILQVPDTENINFSTKILKSNTSSAQQASTSSYVVEIVDGKETIVNTAHREWGDNKEHSTYEKSHNVSGTGVKPQHEYSRHVLDKESHYDTGKDGVPKSSLQVTEESALYKDGKRIASTANTYVGDFTKKKAIKEYVPDSDDVHKKPIDSAPDRGVSPRPTKHDTTITDIKDVKDTTDFITTEKQNVTKETTSATTSETKDTLTTYERSTGTWNGKFVYEKDDDRPKKPKQVSPFGRPEQPRHHLKRQDTEENIILSSRDIKDFTSISDLRKLIENSQTKKDVRVSNKNIVINRNIDDKILKEIIETVKKYPFKRIEKVTLGTKFNEDVKDLYEGIDTEETTVMTTSTGETTRKAFEIEKKKSQIEVTRYITENGITRKITTYEDAKEDDKIRTDVFVDKSQLDFKNLVRIYLITFTYKKIYSNTYLAVVKEIGIPNLMFWQIYIK